MLGSAVGKEKKKKNACVRVHEDEPENEDAEMLKAALKVC